MDRLIWVYLLAQTLVKLFEKAYVNSLWHVHKLFFSLFSLALQNSFRKQFDFILSFDTEIYMIPTHLGYKHLIKLIIQTGLNLIKPKHMDIEE